MLPGSVLIGNISFVFWPQDVEGYVPLSIVAQFQRMQQLTNDLELLRHIASNSDVLTFDVANDTGSSGCIACRTWCIHSFDHFALVVVPQ